MNDFFANLRIPGQAELKNPVGVLQQTKSR
jgi:hypothetical protein